MNQVLIKSIKMKHLLLAILLSTISSVHAQEVVVGIVTENPEVKYQNNNYVIKQVVLTDLETIVVIEVPAKKQNWPMNFSSATVLVPSTVGEIDLDLTSIQEIEKKYDVDKNMRFSREYRKMVRTRKNWILNEKEKLSRQGFLIRSLGASKMDTDYGPDSEGSAKTIFHLHFDRLPEGIENVYVRELIKGGKYWKGIKIRNPRTFIQ
ncbi:MAG: hypothetical protein IKN58_01430 [Prevotella sp.]|nr:hypothetical protein [Prevotella sp.]